MSSQRQSQEKSGRPGAIVLRDFRAFRGPSHALEVAHLALDPGELCAVVGPNGAGKSTLLLALAGLLAYGGHAMLSTGTHPGRELSALPAAVRAKHVAYLGATEELAFAYTVRQVVLFARAPHQNARLLEQPEDTRAVEAALAAWDLTAFAERPATSLSAGETRRVELASIFAQDAQLLLLDEPMTALDFRQSSFAHERLRDHVQKTGATCLFSTHDLAAARAFASRAIVIKRGRIVEDGAALDVLREDRLEGYFSPDARPAP